MFKDPKRELAPIQTYSQVVYVNQNSLPLGGGALFALGALRGWG